MNFNNSLTILILLVSAGAVSAGFYHLPEGGFFGFHLKRLSVGATLTRITEEESRQLGSICGRSTRKRKYPWAVSLSLHVGAFFKKFIWMFELRASTNWAEP